MTCDDAIELLPWLLNGTLEEGERREVRRHLEECERCREALAETRDAWGIFGQHLPAEALVSLAYEEPPTGIDPALAERHLAACPECAAELELARTSRHLEDDRIEVFPARRTREDRGGSRAWRAAALAAGLAGLVVAGGWLRSSREVRRLNGELAQASSAGGSGAGERIALNTWNDVIGRDVLRSTDEVVLPSGVYASPLLEAEKGDTPPEREIEILDEDGNPVLSGSGLRRNEDDYYTFTIHPGALKPGRYTLQLYSTEGGKRTPRETYKVRVE
ncbi:MAG TPA: zf-HC2 domain-containing protein [Thermoanaerobaculia bacterium]|nr:zf-HC2 domain-containing protein [Thermoanaerobaculia bacterium]